MNDDDDRLATFHGQLLDLPAMPGLIDVAGLVRDLTAAGASGTITVTIRFGSTPPT